MKINIPYFSTTALSLLSLFAENDFVLAVSEDRKNDVRTHHSKGVPDMLRKQGNRNNIYSKKIEEQTSGLGAEARILQNSWCQLGDIFTGDGYYHMEGQSVSLSADGTIMAVGTPGGGDYYAGHVAVYKYDNDVWTQLGDDIVGENRVDFAGYAVSLSDDGLTLAVGANSHDTAQTNGGHVRVFKYENDVWTQLGGDMEGDYYYEQAGASVSLSGDGSRVAIGSPSFGPSYKGQVEVFQYDSGVWSKVGNSIVGNNNDELGTSISLSQSGSILATGMPYANVGMYDDGKVQVYQFDGTTWVQLGGDFVGAFVEQELGRSVSLSADGSILAFGAHGSGPGSASPGKALVFEYDGSAWTQMGGDILGEEAADWAGFSVSLSADGTTLAVTSEDGSGQLRVYQYENDNDWIQVGGNIDGNADFHVRGDVSLSADGTIVAVGSPTFNMIGSVTVWEYGDCSVPPLPCVDSNDRNVLRRGVPKKCAYVQRKLEKNPASNVCNRSPFAIATCPDTCGVCGLPKSTVCAMLPSWKTCKSAPCGCKWSGGKGGTCSADGATGTDICFAPTA